MQHIDPAGNIASVFHNMKRQVCIFSLEIGSPGYERVANDIYDLPAKGRVVMHIQYKTTV